MLTTSVTVRRYSGPFTAQQELQFDVPYTEASDLRVTLGDETLELDSDYTVTDVYSEGLITGGVITILSAMGDASSIMVVERVTPITQEQDYPENGPFESLDIERSIDKLTMIAQENRNRQGRMIEVNSAEKDSVVTMLPKATENTQIVTMTSDGVGLADVDPEELNSAVQSAANSATAAENSATAAAGSASAAAQSASAAATSETNAAASEEACEQAVTDVTNAKTEVIADIQEEAQTQIGIIQAGTQDEIDKVEAAADAAVTAAKAEVQQEGTTQVGNVASQGATQVALCQEQVALATQQAQTAEEWANKAAEWATTGGLIVTVVEALPEIGEKNFLYLLHGIDSEGADTYDAYVWIDPGKFVPIGSSSAGGDVYTKAEINTLLDEKQDAITAQAPLVISSVVMDHVKNCTFGEDTIHISSVDDAYVVANPDNSNGWLLVGCGESTNRDLIVSGEDYTAYIDIPYQIGQVATFSVRVESYISGYSFRNFLLGKYTEEGKFVPIGVTVRHFGDGSARVMIVDGANPLSRNGAGNYTSSVQYNSIVYAGASAETKYSNALRTDYTMLQIKEDGENIRITMPTSQTYTEIASSTFSDATVVSNLKQVNVIRLFGWTDNLGSSAVPYTQSSFGLYNFDDFLTNQSKADLGDNIYDLSGAQTNTLLKLDIGDGLSVADGKLTVPLDDYVTTTQLQTELAKKEDTITPLAPIELEKKVLSNLNGIELTGTGTGQAEYAATCTAYNALRYEVGSGGGDLTAGLPSSNILILIDQEAAPVITCPSNFFYFIGKYDEQGLFTPILGERSYNEIRYATDITNITRTTQVVEVPSATKSAAFQKAGTKTFPGKACQFWKNAGVSERTVTIWQFNAAGESRPVRIYTLDDVGQNTIPEINAILMLPTDTASFNVSEIGVYDSGGSRVDWSNASHLDTFINSHTNTFDTGASERLNYLSISTGTGLSVVDNTLVVDTTTIATKASVDTVQENLTTGLAGKQNASQTFTATVWSGMSAEEKNAIELAFVTE